MKRGGGGTERWRHEITFFCQGTWVRNFVVVDLFLGNIFEKKKCWPFSLGKISKKNWYWPFFVKIFEVRKMTCHWGGGSKSGFFGWRHFWMTPKNVWMFKEWNPKFPSPQTKLNFYHTRPPAPSQPRFWHCIYKVRSIKSIDKTPLNLLDTWDKLGPTGALSRSILVKSEFFFFCVFSRYLCNEDSSVDPATIFSQPHWLNDLYQKI